MTNETRTTDFTEAEWRKEIDRLQADDPGLSMAELAAESDMSLSAIKVKVLRGVREGRYVQGFAKRMDARGVRQRVPVYRLNPKFKVKKR